MGPKFCTAFPSRLLSSTVIVALGFGWLFDKSSHHIASHRITSHHIPPTPFHMQLARATAADTMPQPFGSSLIRINKLKRVIRANCFFEFICVRSENALILAPIESQLPPNSHSLSPLGFKLLPHHFGPFQLSLLLRLASPHGFLFHFKIFFVWSVP